MVLQTADKHGWFWYIPQHDNIVSVGVVAPFDYLFKNRVSFEQTYDEEVERCRRRQGADRQGATRVTGYFATKDYSYRATRVAGDGWVLVGDAWGFLDPLYSSGVLLALQVGRAGRRRHRRRPGKQATRPARSSASGGRSSTTASIACAAWSASTTPASASATSCGSIPELRGTVTDLLIGDLFTDRVDKVWAPMESMYPENKAAIPSWDAGTHLDAAPEKANELILPADVRVGI